MRTFKDGRVKKKSKDKKQKEEKCVREYLIGTRKAKV